MGARVLLVEADLRRPTIAQQFDISPGPGLADVLIGVAPMNGAVQSVALDGRQADGAAGRTLDVLVAGATLPPNPGELIESHAMEALLGSAKSAYDLVVIDTPPLTAVSDAFPLLSKVDGVVIVGRVGRNRRDVAQRLHQTLAGAGAPLLGVIANGFKTGRSSYGYSYEYSYTPDKKKAGSGTEPPAVNGAASAPTPERTPTRIP
jgi:receptor protein-tyrosine kinase